MRASSRWATPREFRWVQLHSSSPTPHFLPPSPTTVSGVRQGGMHQPHRPPVLLAVRSVPNDPMTMTPHRNAPARRHVWLPASLLLLALTAAPATFAQLASTPAPGATGPEPKTPVPVEVKAP